VEREEWKRRGMAIGRKNKRDGKPIRGKQGKEMKIRKD
jgi:hypothetical protein